MELWENKGRKLGDVLFNDALNTFYLQLYVGKESPLHPLLFPILI